MAELLTMTAEKYLADPAPQPSLSASIAKILLTQSPLHAKLAHPRLNPAYRPVEDSRFDLGSAAHAMLLERTSDPITWCDFEDWRKNEAKAQRDAARIAGKFPVLTRYRAVLEAMVETARDFIASTELAGILDTGTPEQVVVWKEGDVFCRIRPDMLSADRRICLDYKTTDSAEPETFIRQIGHLGYDVQEQLYTLGLAATGAHASFVFLAQEITEPYACSLIALSNAYRELAALKVKRALRLWDWCIKRNEWPTYGNQIMYAEPAPWDLAQLDHEVAL